MYEEDDLLECIEITDENHEGLTVGALYVVVGISEYDGNIVYTVRNTWTDKLHHSIDRFKLCTAFGDTPQEDMVHHPKHYADRPVEVIEIIRSVLTKEEFIGYCKGCLLKYNMRAGLKDDMKQDYDKGKVYYDWYKESEKN